MPCGIYSLVPDIFKKKGTSKRIFFFKIFFYLKVIWKVGCSFLVKKKLQSIFWTLLNSKRIYDLWEKTKIESNQLYITNGQEEEVRENIKKRNREREKKREKEIRIGLEISSSSLIVDQIHFSIYSTKHSHSIIDAIIYTITRSL